MPSPKNAPKASTKTPEAKGVDLGPKLAKRRSQDFKSKIDDWNDTGAGVAQKQDEVVVLEEKNGNEKKDTDIAEVVVDVDNDDDDDISDNTEPGDSKKDATPTTPKTPKTPVTGTKATATKQSSARKPSREIDPERKAWVRRRSKATPTNNTQPQSKVQPDSKPSPISKPQPEDSPEIVRQLTPKKRVVSDGHWRKDRLQRQGTATPEKENLPAETIVKSVEKTPEKSTEKPADKSVEKTTEKAKEKEKPKAKPKEKETTPKPVVIRRSVVSLGLKVPPSESALDPDPEPSRRRAIRRRTPSRSRSRDREDERAATPDYESSGVKVYIKRRRRSKTTDQDEKARKAFNTSESSFTAPSSVSKISSATDITTPDDAPTKDQPARQSTAPKQRFVKRYVSDHPAPDKNEKTSAEVDDVRQRVRRRRTRSPVSDDGDRRKPSKGKEKAPEQFKIPARHSPPDPVPKVFGNRIQGWLAGMPDDPFTEPEGPVVAPEPLKISRRRSKRVDDPDEKYDSRLRRNSTRRRRSRPSLEPIDIDERTKPASGNRVDDWVDDTTPTLKRSGARRTSNSPTKERARRTESPEGDDDLTPKGIPRRSSKGPTYGELHGRSYEKKGPQLSTIASVSSLQSRNAPKGPRAPSISSDRHNSIVDGSVLTRASDGDEPTRNDTVLRRRLTKHNDLMSILSIDQEDDRGITAARSVRSRRPRRDTISLGDIMNEVTTDELTYQRELRTLVDGVIPVLLQYVLSQNKGARKSDSQRTPSQGDPALTKPIVEMGVALERLKTSHKHIPMHDPKELLLWAQNTAKVYEDYLKVWRLGFNDIVVNLAPAEKDDGLQRNKDGDLVDGDGERVDVAYLLKRPLVRMKSLSKALGGINQIQPSALAEDMSTTYQDLVYRAKQRANDERARLEDEAAAAIDPSRARDLRNLVPLAGVHIDPTRCVRARDYFDMELFHSGGQQLDCKIEVIIRDDAPGRGGSGDILFNEVSPAGRWLLFPPVLVSKVSARRGDTADEIIVMVRGLQQDGSEWREIMSLLATEAQCAEWLEILGSDPLPPKLTRTSSFNTGRAPAVQRGMAAEAPTEESELPIGERAQASAPKWDGSDVNSVSGDLPGSVRRRQPQRYRSSPSSPLTKADTEVGQRADISKLDADPSRPPTNAHGRSDSDWTFGGRFVPQDEHDAPNLSSDRERSDESAEDEKPERRPSVRRRTSSVPGMDLPTINKLRKVLKPDPPQKEPIQRRAESTPVATTKEPTSAPAKLQKQPPIQPKESSNNTNDAHHPVDARQISKGGGLSIIPSFTPAFLKKDRKISSPLKHEYEPSTATESSSESELSDADDASISSDSSLDEEDEAVSTLGELQDFNKFGTLRPLTKREPFKPPPVDGETLGPSESASQAPYRTVPPTDSGAAKSVANLFSWSERGAWDTMHPEECEIVVTPGLIEAFDVKQANAVSSNSEGEDQPSPSARGVKPLVALELTPLVPLRRGTALDISIRSPPTADSVLRNGTNFMLRSRSPEECEKLYNLINRARIDNPTWIALQNARGPVPTSNWAEVMDRRNAARPNNSSWFKALSRKSSTYRSKGTRSASIAGSQSSLGTLNSAFSAIRQFSGSSKIFNVAKSTIMSKQSTRSSYSDSLSSGAVTPLPIDPSMGTPVGITNTKIRFYTRETTTKWRDMGAARLTIMLPPRPDPSMPASPRLTGLEKRVLICGKKGNTLLDVTLGENCFERVARTGIAVSVWEESLETADTGGVVSSKSTVYMLQMKSERDAAFTFSMVGKLRY